MRQVPKYLIIGRGRVATHFYHYLNLLNLSPKIWHRELELSLLSAFVQDATHILLLIADDAISQFSLRYLASTNAIQVHFSGALFHPNIYGAHPLMTFSKSCYSLSDYESIPFVLDECAPQFDHLLPGLKNSSVRLAMKDKARYHALCSMAGNFTCLLWQKLFNSFEEDFSIPKEIAHPYLIRQMNNLLSNPDSALTGPLARGDSQTVNRHLEALIGDDSREIYESFVRHYQSITKRGST